MEDLGALPLYGLLVVLLTAGLLLASWLLGERRRSHATEQPYESGVPPVGNARLRFSAKFFLVAVFFVIFDVETVFLLPWAVAAREVGWAGYAEALIFILVLLAALAYLWRLGALDWVAQGRERPRTADRSK